MCEILSRINDIAEREGISIAVIEKRIGASRGVISKAIKNGTDIQSKWLVLLCDNFPQYSARWLLTGEGNMLKSASTDSDVTHSHDITPSPNPVVRSDNSDLFSLNVKEKGAIPLVSEKAIGGFYNQDFNIPENDIKGYYIVPKFRHLGVNFLIEVIGDSMIPRFFPGDIIACSILSNPNFIQWNKCHLIATREQGMIIKRLMPSDKKNCLSAVSDNKDYPPFDLPKSEICGLARIVGSIHVE